MAGWDDVPDSSAPKTTAKASGWDAVPDSTAPDADGFRTLPGASFPTRKVITPDTGKPAEQRRDGAIYYGKDQGNTGTEGWFNDKGERVGLGNGEARPGAGSLFLKGLQKAGLGMVRSGAQMAEGDPLSQMSLNLTTPDGAEQPKAVDQSAMARIREINKTIKQGTFGGKAAALAGEATPTIAMTAAMPGASAPAFGTRFVANALPASIGAALTSEGNAAEKGGMGALTVPLAYGGQILAEDVINPAAKWIGGKIGGLIRSAPEAATSAGTEAAVSAVPEAAAAVAPEVTPELVGKTARKAAGSGFGSTQAKTDLAGMAQFSPEAKAAADRLGMELPADVLSDNPQVRAAAGLTRSVAGSEPEAAWKTTVSNAANRADRLMQDADAHFASGTTAPASVSDKVNKTLVSERDAIAKQTAEAYGAVDAAVPKESLVQMDRLGATLADIEKEVGSGGMTKQESRLAAMLADPENPPTYGRLIREKNLIGQAISGRPSPYGDLDTASLKRLYSALAEDQLANVGDIAGKEVQSQLHGANLLYAKQKGLESRLVGAFGKEGGGSISTQMQQAITQSAKGDSKAFNNLLKVVPEDLQKETLITALANATRATKDGNSVFGFAQFAKTWQGIKANTPVYERMQKALGPDTVAMLDDLQGISQRLTESRANVLTTGKANQALVGSMAKETAFQNLLDSTGAHVATSAAGAAGGGPFGAAASSLIHTAMSKLGRDPLRATGNLFNSPEFLQLVEKVAAGGKPSGASVESVVLNPKFQAFAAQVKDMPKGVSNQAGWLISRIAANRGSETIQNLPKAASASSNPDVAQK